VNWSNTAVSNPRYADAPTAPLGRSEPVWAVVAQGLSGATNFGIQAGLAATVSPNRFGAVVVGLGCYFGALASARSVAGDPLVALWDTSERRARLWRQAIARYLAIATVAALAMFVGIWLFGGPSSELVGVAIAMPVLLGQDAYRYRLWAQRRPRGVAGLDAIWAGVTLALVLVGISVDSSPGWGPMLVWAWAIGGCVSLAVAIWMQGPIATISGRNAGVGLSQAGALARSQVVLALDSNLQPGVLAAAAGASTAAVVRAVTIPFAPIAIVVGALRMLALSRLGASGHLHTERPMVARALATNTVAALGLIGFGVAMAWSVPQAWLGEVGAMIRPWYPLGGILMAARMLSAPLSDAVALGSRPHRAVGMRIGLAILDWGATVAGAVVFGPVGAVIGKAAALSIGLVGWLIEVFNPSNSKR